MAYPASRFAHIPKLQGGDGFDFMALYAVEFSNGIVKYGRTSCPRRRVTELENTAKRVGVVVTRYFISSAVGPRAKAMAAEREVGRRICRIGNPCRGSIEFISHAKFGELKTIVRQVAARNAA